MADRIFQQIEDAADYYDPDVYRSRLTYYQSLELEVDPLSGQFIPLSTAQPNPKLFAIGIIPPSAVVTGKTLDRSHSIAALAGGGGSNLSGQAEAGTAATGGAGGNSPGTATMTSVSFQQAGTAIREAFHKQTGRYPSDNELAIYVGQSNHETSLNWPDFNPGFVGNASVKSPRGNHARFYWPPTKTTFFSYSNAVDGADGFLRFVPPAAREAAKSGDALAYATALANGPGGSYYAGANGGPPNEAEIAAYARGLSVNFVKQKMGPQSAMDPSTLPTGNLGVGSDANVTSWNQLGKDAAGNAQRQIAKGAQINLNSTDLGQKFAAAQSRMIQALQTELDNMANTPPLQLLINPQSFKVAGEQIISDGNWTRSGPIIEHWGESQDKIDGSGKIAAFYAMSATDANSPGLTRTARNFSASYQNLLSLYQLYRNNAGLYLRDDIESGAGNRTNLAMSGSIYLYYDQTLYIGSFDSFTITEADTAPFSLEYSFSFVARATFLLDSVADPKYTYGFTSLDVNNTNASNVVATSAPETTIPYRSLADVQADLTTTPALQDGISKVQGAQQPGSLGLPVFINGKQAGSV